MHFTQVRWLYLVCCMFGMVRAVSRPDTAASPSAATPPPGAAGRSEFLDIRPNGGYRFSYSTGDAGRHYHAASATPGNTVSGRYGSRDPATGRDLQTVYTAGRRGFRANGPHIARRMNLSQNKIPYNPPVSPDSPNYNPTYSGYHDPNEDATYSFGFRTRSYNRRESSDARGSIEGRYSFLDDIGVRHDVAYEAGAKTGFHVKTPYPDSSPISSSIFFAGPAADKKGKQVRGHTAILRGKDGSYRFTSVGPDQRRTEEKDAAGRVKGVYTYLDDKGVQRTTQYIAGPNIGYKVVNTESNNRFPSVYPPYLPPYNFLPTPGKEDDVFGFPDGLNAAESGPGVKPTGGPATGGNKDTGIPDSVGDFGFPEEDKDKDSIPSKPPTDLLPGIGAGGGQQGPSKDKDGDDDFTAPFGGAGAPSPGLFGNDDDLFGPPLGDKGDGNVAGGDDLLIPDYELDKDIAGGNGFLSGAAGTNIPYGNCCKFAPTRRSGSKKIDSIGSGSSPVEGFGGFPPGIAVKAHVQSLDIRPSFGARIPSPSAALEISSSGLTSKPRREIRTEEKPASTEAPVADSREDYSEDSSSEQSSR